MIEQQHLVQWHSDKGEWLIAPADGPFQTLEAWAREQEERSAVSLVLSASNYVAHWVQLPGVKPRQLARALPFALEEHLIGDIEDYSFIPAASVGGVYRAYVVATQLLDDLIELMALHHLNLVSLVPETSLLPLTASVWRKGDGYQLLFPGRFEGLVPEAAIAATLEYLCQEALQESLIIYAPSLDQANILRTSIETGYPEAFDDIQVATGTPELITSKTNLLQGKVVELASDSKPAPWWRGLAGFAACFALVGMAYLFTANQQLQSQVDQVSDASLALYKQWFPGERTSNYEVLFKRKLRGDSSSAVGVSFPDLMAQVSEAWGASSNINIHSVRYSDRNNDFILEVVAKTQADLETFKANLEGRGLQAAIASATQDKGEIKGRLKIRGAV